MGRYSSSSNATEIETSVRCQAQIGTGDQVEYEKPIACFGFSATGVLPQPHVPTASDKVLHRPLPLVLPRPVPRPVVASI